MPWGAPLPNCLRPPRRALRFGIRNQRRDGAARAGKNADQGADHRAPGKIEFVSPEDASALPEAVAPGFGGDLEVRVRRCNEVDENGDAIKTDERRNHFDAAQQDLASEREARVGTDLGDADARQQKSEAGADQALERGAARQRGDQRQAEDRQPEVFDRSEGESDLGQRRREADQERGADETAHHRRQTGDGEGEVAVAALGHGIAVERRGDGRRGARRVEQYRRVGTPVNRAGVDRSHQDQRRRGRHRKGQRNQDGDRHGRGQARQRADHGPRHDARERENEVERMKGREQIVDAGHRSTSPFAVIRRCRLAARPSRR